MIRSIHVRDQYHTVEPEWNELLDIRKEFHQKIVKAKRNIWERSLLMIFDFVSFCELSRL